MFLASLFGTDNKPTFLELVSQEQLLLGLRPALERVLGRLGGGVPGRNWLRTLHQHTDEVWLFLLILLESRSLHSNGATVAEQFYGLRREPKRSDQTPRGQEMVFSRRIPFNSTLVWAGVLEAAVLPYLRVKLDAIYRDMYIRSQTSSRNAVGAFWKRHFLRLYPSLRSLDYFFTFIFRIMYLFRRSEYYSWPLRLQRTIIVRDHIAAGFRPSLSSGNCLQRSVDYVFRVGRFSLIFGLYLLRFIDWFRMNAERERREQLRSQSLPPPPAPLIPPHARNLLPGGCAVCHKRECVEPSVCLVSGYVFCDECLRGYIRVHHRCPLTRMAASEDDVRRLYLSGGQ